MEDSEKVGKQFSLWLDGELRDEVERIAKREGCSKGYVIKRLMMVGLERLRQIETAGRGGSGGGGGAGGGEADGRHQALPGGDIPYFFNLGPASA